MGQDGIVEFLEDLTNQARKGNLTDLAVAYRFNGRAPVAFKSQEGQMVTRVAPQEKPPPADVDDLLRY